MPDKDKLAAIKTKIAAIKDKLKDKVKKNPNSATSARRLATSSTVTFVPSDSGAALIELSNDSGFNSFYGMIKLQVLMVFIITTIY